MNTGPEFPADAAAQAAINQALVRARETGFRYFVIRRLNGTRYVSVPRYAPTDEVYAECYPGGRVVLWGEQARPAGANGDPLTP